MNEQRTSGSEGERADQPAGATPSADQPREASTTRIDRSAAAPASDSSPGLSEGQLPSATAPADRPTDATTTVGRLGTSDGPSDKASDKPSDKAVEDKAGAAPAEAGSPDDAPVDGSTTRIDRATAAAAAAGTPAGSSDEASNPPVEASTSRIPWPPGAETRAGSSGAANANAAAATPAQDAAAPAAGVAQSAAASQNSAPTQGSAPTQNAVPAPPQGTPYQAQYPGPGAPAYGPGGYGPGPQGEVTTSNFAYGAPPQAPGGYPGQPQGAAAPPYGQYGQPGQYGPPGPGAPGQPPYGGPTVATAGYPPQGGPPWPGYQQAPPRRRKTPLIVAAVIVVLILIAGAIFFLIPPSAKNAVAGAAGEVRTWSGVTYRGDVRGPGGQPVTVDVTVSPNGDKVGTLTRPGGGKADFAELAGVQVLRGDSQWWNGQPQGAEKTKRLAGLWLRSPSPETSWLGPLPLLTPTALADDLTGPPGATPNYTDAGDLTVDGQDGRIVEWPSHRVVLTDGLSPKALSVVPTASADPVGLRVSAAAPDQLGKVDSTRSAAANAEDYTATLYAPTGVRVELPQAPPCTTPTCVTTVNLTNTAGIEARGFVTIKENGVVLSKTPFRIPANGRQTVTATSQNQAYITGMDTTVNVEASVSSD